MKNNTSPRPEGPACTNVIYKFSCPSEDCTPLDCYVGQTRTTLSRRMSYHLSSGGPKTHLLQKHKQTITRQILEENTTILAKEKDRTRLAILEALFIKDLQPSINRQIEVPTILPSMKPLPTTRINENRALLRRSTIAMERTPTPGAHGVEA